MGRLAGAPISWGVCEVPGWGRMLPPERVFAEMAELGLRATELGPIGYLPYEPQAIRERLDRHGLRLIGGFVPLVLHERDLAPTRAAAERSAAVLAQAGAELFVAAVVADDDWSPPRPLDDDAWNRLAANLQEIEGITEAARADARAAPSRRHPDRDRRRDRARAGGDGRRLVPRHRPPGHRRLRSRGLRPPPRRPHRARPPQGRGRRDRRPAARQRAVTRRGDAGRAVPPTRKGRRRHRRSRELAGYDRVRALARARAGHRHHRGGAAGGKRSGHRCSDEHRVPALAGSPAGERVAES